MAITQITKILIRRGLESDLPDQLDSGELGYAVDTRKLFIGNGTIEEGAPVEGNTEVLTEHSDISNQVLSYQPENTVIKNNSNGVTFARFDANSHDTFFMKYSVLRGVARAMSTPIGSVSSALFKSGSELIVSIGQETGAPIEVVITFGGEAAFADISIVNAVSQIKSAISGMGATARLTTNNEIEITADYSPITLSRGNIIVSSNQAITTAPIVGTTHAADMTINNISVIVSKGQDAPTITAFDINADTITFSAGHGLLGGDFIAEKPGSAKFLNPNVTFSKLTQVSTNVFKVSTGLYAAPDTGAATATVYKGSAPLPSTLTDVVTALNLFNTTSDNNKIPGLIAARNVANRLVMEFDADYIDLEEGMPDSPNDVLDALYLTTDRYENALHGLGLSTGIYSAATAIGTIEVIGDPTGNGNVSFTDVSTDQGETGVEIYPVFNKQNNTIEFKYNAADLNSSAGAKVDGLINFEARRWKSNFQLLASLSIPALAPAILSWFDFNQETDRYIMTYDENALPHDRDQWDNSYPMIPVGNQRLLYVDKDVFNGASYDTWFTLIASVDDGSGGLTLNTVATLSVPTPTSSLSSGEQILTIIDDNNAVFWQLSGGSVSTLVHITYDVNTDQLAFMSATDLIPYIGSNHTDHSLAYANGKLILLYNTDSYSHTNPYETRVATFSFTGTSFIFDSETTIFNDAILTAQGRAFTEQTPIENAILRLNDTTIITAALIDIRYTDMGGGGYKYPFMSVLDISSGSVVIGPLNEIGQGWGSDWPFQLTKLSDTTAIYSSVAYDGELKATSPEFNNDTMFLHLLELQGNIMVRTAGQVITSMPETYYWHGITTTDTPGEIVIVSETELAAPTNPPISIAYDYAYNYYNNVSSLADLAIVVSNGWVSEGDIYAVTEDSSVHKFESGVFTPNAVFGPRMKDVPVLTAITIDGTNISVGEHKPMFDMYNETELTQMLSGDSFMGGNIGNNILVFGFRGKTAVVGAESLTAHAIILRRAE